MRRMLLGACALALFASSALAAVTPNSVVTLQTPKNGKVNFVQGTDAAGTYKTLYTAGANGSKCVMISESNDDASATHLITVAITNGGTTYVETAVQTGSSDGYANGDPPKNLMSAAVWPSLPIDSDGDPYIYLVSGDTLQATYATTLTTSDLITLTAVCADF